MCRSNTGAAAPAGLRAMRIPMLRMPPLEVGDVVNVPTKYGESEAQVCRINVPEEDIPAWCGSLRHITEAAVPQDMFSEFFA